MTTALSGTLPDASAKITAEEEKAILENFSKYDQQCIMIKEMKQFLDRPDRNKEYKNLVYVDIQTVEESLEANNIIHGSKYFEPFVNVPNHILSALVPKIRLYKSYIVDGGTFDIEIPMEDRISEEDILSDNISRGFGYGLESFSWENTSFNEADRNISADLVLKFSNMDSFTKTRKGIIAGDPEKVQNPEKYRDFKFIELIYQVPSKTNAPQETQTEKERLQQLPNKFKIKVSIGWEFAENVLNDLRYDGDIDKLKTAIRANNIVLYLFNKGHDLKLDKEGRATVTINYQSVQEARLSDERKSNVLGNTKTLKDIEEIEKKIEEEKKINQNLEPAELAKIIDPLEKNKELAESNVNFKIYSDFLDSLFNKNVIRLCKITNKDLVKLKTALYPSAKSPSLMKIDFNSVKPLELEFKKTIDTQLRGLNDPQKPKTESSVSSTIEELKKILIKKQGEEIIIPYFYFGELLSIIVENININNTEEEYEPVRLMTGPFIYQRLESTTLVELQKINKLPVGKEAISIKANIADIPISFEFFLSWFDQEIVSQRKRTLTLKSFLSSVLNKFIVNVLQPNCFGKKFLSSNPKTDIHLVNSVAKNGIDILTGLNATKRDNLTKTITIDDIRKIDQLNKFGNTENLNVIPYVYMQIFYSDTKYRFIINEAYNAQQSVYHLKMGVDRGLVKEINFSKDDLTAMPVAIYSQQGTINPRVLRTPYNAEVSMVGNTIFKPGSTVYIDPTYTLSLPLTKTENVNVIEEMGLGGFYIITATRNSISAGKFSTQLSCRFTNYGTRE
jgi:hypothetical protein